MWEGVPVEQLVSDVQRAERLRSVWNSALGDDLRGVIIDVANAYLIQAMEGNRNMIVGLQAMRDLLQAFESVIEVGASMRAEIASRIRGNGSA